MSQHVSMPLIVLGVDPGLANTGWGVVAKKGGKYYPLAYGCIHTSAELSTAERLKHIFDDITEVCHKYNPSELSIESIFFGVNASSAFSTGQAKGAVLVACANLSMKTFEYTPMQIKQSVVGTGAATKEQVQYMVRSILGFDHIPSPDHAADALAAAVCHGNMRELKQLEQDALRGGKR